MTTLAGVTGMTAEEHRSGVGHVLNRAWRINAPLTATGLLMAGVLAASAIGLLIDPRVITGVPIWLKPAKFAISIGVYVATVVWVFTYLAAWTKIRAFVGWVTALTMIVEMVVILAQVSRGTSSHFNTSTPLNATLWSTMGLAILVQTIASVGLAVAIWRARFADRAMGWAFKVGLTLSILGASSGSLMTAPTAAQLETMRAGGRPVAVGAHTVGAPDGGPGLTGTGWSTEHGDLRVPHFLGLHGFQALPLLVLAARRRKWSERQNVRLIAAAAASYLLLFAVLLAEALRGYSIARPDGTTLVALGAWAMLSVAVGVFALAPGARDSRPAH